MLTLEPASETPPADLASMLQELGDGDAGFGGTPFGRGELSLAQYLEDCIKNLDPAYVSAGRVPGVQHGGEAPTGERLCLPKAQQSQGNKVQQALVHLDKLSTERGIHFLPDQTYSRMPMQPIAVPFL